MGYLSDAAKTRETFDRGFWLLSGDLGIMEDGFLTIKGRIKDVIITSGGKNIAPHPIEERIKVSRKQQSGWNCVASPGRAGRRGEQLRGGGGQAEAPCLPAHPPLCPGPRHWGAHPAAGGCSLGGERLII